MGHAVKKKTPSIPPDPRLPKTVVAVIPEDEEEDDLNALLGDEKPKNPTQKKTNVPRNEAMKGPLVAFRTKKGQLIIARAARYYVARVENKLHYKPEAECTKLPENWKEGDIIPPGPGTVKIS